MYICKECGDVFNQFEVDTWEEDRGEFWGMPCYERMSGCPNCRGDYVEAKRCVECGAWIPEDDWDMCEECMADYENEEICLELGVETEDEIKLNGFLLSVYSRKEIEKILLEHLKQDEEKMANAIKDYCEWDTMYFIEWVRKKWKEEK
jgi:hypothetical protein